MTLTIRIQCEGAQCEETVEHSQNWYDITNVGSFLFEAGGVASAAGWMIALCPRCVELRNANLASQKR